MGFNSGFKGLIMLSELGAEHNIM